MDEAMSAANAANKKSKSGRGSLTPTNMGEVNARAKKGGHGKGTNPDQSPSAAKKKSPMMKKGKK